MNLRRRPVVLLACVMLLATGAWMPWSRSAPATWSASEVKAAFLYRFAGYVEWPEAAMRAPRFVIAVFGAERIATSLERSLATLAVKDRPAEVRRIADLRAARQAHLVYIGREHAAELGALLPQLDGHPVLIVTDSEQGLDHGAMLNFRTVAHRVRFEVALDNAEDAGLAISADLLAVALNVRRRNLRSDEFCPPGLLHVPWLRCPTRLLARRPRACLAQTVTCAPLHPSLASLGPWLPTG